MVVDIHKPMKFFVIFIKRSGNQQLFAICYLVLITSIIVMALHNPPRQISSHPIPVDKRIITKNPISIPKKTTGMYNEPANTTSSISGIIPKVSPATMPTTRILIVLSSKMTKSSLTNPHKHFVGLFDENTHVISDGMR